MYPRNTGLKQRYCAILMGWLVLAVPGYPLYAQADASAQDSGLEEIVVTAQKREQSLQDVGISITAFSGDQLAA